MGVAGQVSAGHGETTRDLVGRLNLQKALVIVAAQDDGAGIGRIRMRQIIDVHRRTA